MKTMGRQIGTWAVLASVCVLMGCQAGGTAQGGKQERWWRGNWHTHSRWSDGDSFPEMVVKWYAEHGYNFLVLTDHVHEPNDMHPPDLWLNTPDKKTNGENFKAYMNCFGESWVETRTAEGVKQVHVRKLEDYRHLFERPNEFMLMAGEEISMQGRVHVNAFNIVDIIPAPERATNSERLQTALDIVAEQRQRTGQMMLAQVNHPNWCYTLTAEEIAPLRDAHFLEVYNSDDATNNNAGDGQHPSVERIWDIVLTKRLAELHLPIIYGTADEDAHHFLKWGRDKSNPGRSWVMVRAAKLTPESVMNAMLAGDYYFSSGVELSKLWFDGQVLDVAVRPELFVKYKIQFIGTRRGYDPAGRAVLDAKGAEAHITRVYSDQIGAVLAEVDGPRASYRFTGDELYVRAKVVSSRVMPNGNLAMDKQCAWTQPVLMGGGQSGRP